MTKPILIALLALAAPAALAETNPLFVFDNGLRGPGLETIDAQLDLVRDVGFAGLSWRTDTPERIRQVLDGCQKRGLKLYVIYCNLELKDGKLSYDNRLPEIIRICRGSGAMLWPNMTSKQFKNSSPDGDAIAVAGLRGLADQCAANDMPIAIYPHVNMWVHRVEDAVRVARKVDRKNVGVTFNLCHALLDGAGARIPTLIDDAAPNLLIATINGADHDASAKQMGKAIQPLGQGTYDVGALLAKLRAAGYRGPIGLQCYNLKGDPRQILQGAMAAWRKLNATKN